MDLPHPVRQGRTTVGDSLEGDRLARRERRLDLALRELRTRAHAAGEREVPRPLGHAIRDFERQLRDVRARLHAQPR
jgi:hypothetical protein